MGRFLVILLVICLIVFSQLHERFVSTHDQCIINNCRQNSPKYQPLHARQAIEEYCFNL